jgi:hypothetical protein
MKHEQKVKIQLFIHVVLHWKEEYYRQPTTRTHVRVSYKSLIHISGLGFIFSLME